MRCGTWLAWLFVVAWCAGTACASGTEPVDLVYMNRVVYTMRATVAGASPAARERRAQQRLGALDARDLAHPVEALPVSWNGRPAVTLRVGSATLLTVFPEDIDPETGGDLQALAQRTRYVLQDALDAQRELVEPRALARGLGRVFLGTVLWLLSSWAAIRAVRALAARWQASLQRQGAAHRMFGLDWSGFALSCVGRLLRVVAWLLLAALAAAWLAYALAQFAATQPIASSMGSGLRRLALASVQALWSALPGLGMVLLILALARAATWAVGRLLQAVGDGSFNVPGLHRDTAHATRRLANALLWGLAVATLYPYIPGSRSEVFRAMSVFLGFVLTLGSTGIAAQWMAGVVLVYARALRVGDYASVGQVQGTVTQLGPLSVKILDDRGDEVTVPNTVVLASGVSNASRGAPAGRAGIRVPVSVGYDVPWRQVHAMLESAAAATQGVLREPPSFVQQRRLDDFYAVYELVVRPVDHRQHADVLSRLLANVQDAFNAAGVQLLSPHFHWPPPQPGRLAPGPWLPDPPPVRRSATLTEFP